MSAFAAPNFKTLNYNSFRPQYPLSFFKLLLEYTGKSRLSNAIDLGCGTGVASFPLLNFCDNVVGLDSSSLMIETANLLKNSHLEEMAMSDESRINFVAASVDSFISFPESYDLITAAECIHWFGDYDKFFATAAEKLRPGATLAYWYYVDPFIVDFSGPSHNSMSKEDILKKFTSKYEDVVYENELLLGPHWQQPGRSILQNGLTDVDKYIPERLFGDIKIRKYKPKINEPYKNDDLRLERKDISLLDYRSYISTYSSYHNYDQATGKGEELLESFLEMCERDLGWDKEKTKLTVQWSAGYTFMRKK